MAERSARPELEGKSLRGLTARGSAINAIFQIGLDTLGLIKGFVVAFFLSASDYGVWGILVIGLGTLVWLKQVGISDKYLQQDEEDQEAAFQRAFTMELLLSALVGLAMLILAPILAVVYGEPKILPPALVVIFLILPANALQAPTWVFWRRMQFARQRLYLAIDPILAFIVTVVLAAAGAGYWSLIVGTLCGAWASGLVATLASPYRFAWRYDRGVLREYAEFSWPILIAVVSALVIAQGSILAGEIAVGLAGVGAIALASAVSLYTDRVDQIVTAALYPAICAVRDRRDLLFEAFVKSNRMALLWAAPFGIGLALFAPDLVDFGLGQRWEIAVPLLQAFGLIQAMNHVGFNYSAFYRALGDTRPIAVVSLAAAIAFLVAAVPLVLTRGLDGFAVGMGVVVLVSLIARGVYLARLFNGFRIALHAARAFLPTTAAAGLVLAVRWATELERSRALALAELAAYLAVAVVVSALLERGLLRELWGYLARGPSAGTAAVPEAR